MDSRCVFLALAFVLASASASDDGCTSQGGSCVDWRYYTCHAGVATGLCDGDSNRRCCLDCDIACLEAEDGYKDQDVACTGEGGECKDNSNYCDGIYTSGKCGGDGVRQCCQQPAAGDCPAIVSRSEWGARPPKSSSPIGDNLDYLFIHHSAGVDCYDKTACIAEVQSIQNYHMDGNGWSDIGYSFLIGGDGNVYEGRGWNIQGAHTSGFNTVGYGIDFIGTFTSKNPEQIAQDAYRNMANCALSLGKVKSTYAMKGHRDTGATECPGNTFYETIQSYPDYVPGYIG